MYTAQSWVIKVGSHASSWQRDFINYFTLLLWIIKGNLPGITTIASEEMFIICRFLMKTWDPVSQDRSYVSLVKEFWDILSVHWHLSVVNACQSTVKSYSIHYVIYLRGQHQNHKLLTAENLEGAPNSSTHRFFLETLQLMFNREMWFIVPCLTLKFHK